MYQRKISRLCQSSIKLGLTLAMGISAAWMPATFAQTSETNSGDGKWMLGIGAVTIDKVYHDFDQKIMPLPLVNYENKWVSVGIPVSDFKVWTGESLSFRIRARFSGEGYEEKDSPYLEGMEERKFSAWVGGAVIWKTHFANVSGEVLADVMGNSKGMRVKLQIDRRFTTGKVGITPRLSAEWVDDKYVDYYYGVRASEVRMGRPFHEGKATTNMQIGLRVDYTPARHHTVFMDLGATRFGSSIKGSPIVDKSIQTSIGLGYVYSF